MGLRTEWEADAEPRPPVTLHKLQCELAWHEEGMAAELRGLLTRMHEDASVRRNRRVRHAWHASHLAALRISIKRMESLA